MSEKVYGICENKCLKEVIVKEDIAIITNTQTLEYSSSGYKENSWDIPYPEGFDKSNTNVLSFEVGLKGCFNLSSAAYVGGYGEGEDIFSLMGGMLPRKISLANDYMRIYCTNLNTSDPIIVDYKIVLMKA